MNSPSPATSQALRPEQTETGSSGPPQCQNCGTVVSADYVRVFSDDSGTLQHCHNCKSRTKRYSNDPVIEA